MKIEAILSIILGVLVVVLLCIVAAKHTPTAPEIAKLIVIPAPVVTTNTIVANDTVTSTKLDKLLEDTNFKDACKTTATAEWTRNGYKEIYNFIDENQTDINEKSDIVYVTIKDEQVNSFDVSDKTCDVSQEVKVKYNAIDSNGYDQDKTLYLEIDSEIDTGDVDNTIDLY